MRRNSRAGKRAAGEVQCAHGGFLTSSEGVAESRFAPREFQLGSANGHHTERALAVKELKVRGRTRPASNLSCSSGTWEC